MTEDIPNFHVNFFWLQIAGDQKSPYCMLGIQQAWRKQDLLRLSNTIHKFMPVELFPLEGNQITHAFWKLLMTAFQSALGWLSMVICIFIYCSYIKKFTPVRNWQSASTPNLFQGGDTFLSDIIQISFYQEWGWHNRWRHEKYEAYSYGILMSNRHFSLLEGLEVAIFLQLKPHI